MRAFPLRFLVLFALMPGRYRMYPAVDPAWISPRPLRPDPICRGLLPAFPVDFPVLVSLVPVIVPPVSDESSRLFPPLFRLDMCRLCSCSVGPLSSYT